MIPRYLYHSKTLLMGCLAAVGGPWEIFHQASRKVQQGPFEENNHRQNLVSIKETIGPPQKNPYKKLLWKETLCSFFCYQTDGWPSGYPRTINVSDVPGPVQSFERLEPFENGKADLVSLLSDFISMGFIVFLFFFVVLFMVCFLVDFYDCRPCRDGSWVGIIYFF